MGAICGFDMLANCICKRSASRALRKGWRGVLGAQFVPPDMMFLTAEHGTIEFITDGKSLQVRTERP